MAEKIVNNGIEFAYVSSNASIELKKELEKYFLYQNVIIVDRYYEFGNIISKLKENVMCNIIVERNFESIKDFENISCIIVVNSHDLNNIKLLCKEQNIPYILALTDICDSLSFKNYLYKNGSNYTDCNYPLGIVFSIEYIFNKSEFISKTILEISSLSFDFLQDKINNLFFQKNKIEYNHKTSKKILQDLQNFIINNDNSTKSVVDVCKIYLSYSIYQSKIHPNVLDNLTVLHNLHYKEKNSVETKYIFSLLITSLEKNFFLYYTNSFQNTINYKKHIEYLSSINQKSSFNRDRLVNGKINFLLQEFRNKVLENIKIQLSFENYIKSQIADIDVDYLYNIFSKIKDVQFTNLICIEQDIFNDINFLTIMYNSGLLNFEF